MYLPLQLQIQTSKPIRGTTDESNSFTQTQFFLKAGMIAAFCLLQSGCLWTENGETIYILNRLSDMRESKTEMPEPKFQLALANAVDRTHSSTLSILNQDLNNNDFELSRLSLGLKIEAEIGIKHIIDLGGEAAFELRFERLPAPELDSKEQIL